MQRKEQTKMDKWNIVKYAGIAIVIIGVISLALSAVGMASGGAAAHASYSGSYSGSHQFNGTYAKGNFTAGARLASPVFAIGAFEGIINGVLLIALGFLVFKYSGLKIDSTKQDYQF